MAGFVLSSLAEADIEGILAWTHEQFGEAARLRYEELLFRTIPAAPYSRDVPDCWRRPETLLWVKA